MSRPLALQSLLIPLDTAREWRAQRLRKMLLSSPRKYEIVCHLARGHREAQIAELIDLRRGTVHAHVTEMFTALQVHDRLVLGIVIGDVLRILTSLDAVEPQEERFAG